jgi:hypothetical protein
MRRPKCAPIAARSTRGDQAWAQPGVSSTSVTPTAAAVRRMVPRLPGSCTPSSTTGAASATAGGVGDAITASTPLGDPPG